MVRLPAGESGFSLIPGVLTDSGLSFERGGGLKRSGSNANLSTYLVTSSKVN